MFFETRYRWLLAAVMPSLVVLLLKTCVGAVFARHYYH